LPLSNVNTRFGELIPKASEFIFFGMTLLVQLLYACALLAGMLFMSWRETLLAVCLMLILGLVVLRGTRFLTAASEDIARQSLYLEASIIRISKNWVFIRLMHTIHREMLAFLNAVQNYYRQGVRMFFCVNVLSVLPEFVGMMSITLLIFIKIYGFGRGGAELLIFFYLFVRFIQAMSFVNDQFGKMGNCWHHACEMLDLTSSLTPAEIKDALDDRPLDHREIWRDVVQQKSEKPLPCPDLQLHHVSFTWPGMDAPLFEDLSVIITAGAHYGVIGPNGSGKSTLLALALGVLEPDRGVVRIGGIEPGQFVKKRRDLGFVGAEPYLFEGTIFENITYGCGREMTDEEVWAALETVGLLATVRQLKGALHAKIGEGGDGFSSGEKQRLALGRAILRRPTLLVMDEATANLDSKMENDVVKILRSLHGACTVITVTHRSEILKAADAVLDLGKLPSRRTV
jgi:ABC-type multidrug transport system fused ATPase/permease subunit